jgi:hypothetical protein
MKVLVLCSSEKTYSEGLSSKILNALFGNSSEEYDFYYIGVQLQRSGRKCSSAPQEMAIRCSHFFDSSKYDIIISENCPIKGSGTLYNSVFAGIIREYLKTGGYYVSYGNARMKIQDAQSGEESLHSWLGSKFQIINETDISRLGTFVVFEKTR